MGQDQGQVGAPVEEKRPEEIRREIDATRQALGETVAELAAKTDIKARAKEKVAGVKEKVGSEAPAAIAEVKTKARQNPIVVAAVAALVGGLLIRRLTSRS